MNEQVLRLSLLLALCASHVFADHTEATTAPRLPFFHGMGFLCYTTGTRSELTDPATYTGLAAKGFDYVRLPIDFRKCSSYNSGTEVCTLNENTTTTSSGWWGQTTTVLGFSSFDAAIDCAEAAGQTIVIGFGNWNDMDPTNESQRKQYKATWRAVAQRYANRSNRLVFEMADKLTLDMSNNTKATQFNTLQKEAIAIIRQTNPTRLILYSAPDGSSPWVLTANNWWVAPPTDDNNVAVSITCYQPPEFCNQGNSQVRLTSSHIGTLNWNLQQIGAFKTNRGIPIVLSEFNVDHTRADHGDVTQFLSRITSYCEANDIPWSPWMYYANNAKDCCDSSGELLDFVKAGLFPNLTTVDDFDPASYDKAMEITFSGYSGTTALANFPVLVKLSEDDIYGFLYSDFQKADGADLCFTDAAGNLLAHEIDTWNPSGVSTVWVKVPSLAASTKIVARYGCAKPVLPKVESVWDADYVGVWHLGESALPLADSTGVSRDATSADGTGIGYGSAGVVGGAVNFGAAGSSRCVNMDDHNALDGFAKVTIEAWTKQSAHASGAGIVSKCNYSGSSGSLSYYMFDDGTATTLSYSPDGSTVVSAGVALQPSMGQWNHQAFTLDATASADNSKGYLNGLPKGTDSVSCPGGLFAGEGELHVGNLHSGNAANFPGLIDEVRISKCVRSADWIKASYDTVAKVGFASYEVLGSGGHNPTLTVDVADGATATLGAGEAVVEEWTRRIVKTGDGTLVGAPLSETHVSALQVEGGTVKLAASSPASVVSTLGGVSFAAGTALDLSGKSYAVAELGGSPAVLDAATFTLNGGWTIQGTNAMTVAGSLAFGPNANVALADPSLFADVTHAGVAIATATGGITGMPSIAGDDFEIAVSADGKTLLLCSTTPDEPDWTAFSKSFTITFDGYAGGAALADFPVLVRLSPGTVSGFRYSDFRKENGGDLRFSDENGNLIPHEIDTWDTSDESTVWVKVPTLTRTTQITAHYGCLRPVRPLDPKNVWSNGYAGVWHLGEGAPTLAESSGASTGFSSSNGAGIGYAASGIVGGAVDFGDTGGGRRLDADDGDSLDGFDAFTIEMWTWQTGRVTGSGDRVTGLLAKRNAYDDQMSWFVHDNGSNLVLSVSSDGLHGTTRAAELVSPALGTWQHVAFTYDSGAAGGSCFKGYLEGLFAKATGQSAGRVFAGAGDLHLGCLGLNDARNFPGRIDEVRISNVARSADWVRASHDTVADANFATCARVVSAMFDPDSRLVAYPEYPAQIERDYAYGVTVTQGDTTTNLVVYNHCEKSPLADRTHGGDVNRRFCEFAFSGDPVRVDVAVCEDIQAYKVFPARLNLQSSFDRENGVISVWLDTPHSFGIELNDSVKSILSVLVDEPEDPADVPSPGDAGVMYVGGWTDAPGPNGVLAISNQCSEVYIAPGAVLNARLYLKRQGVRVHGRGMILDPFSDIFRYDQRNNTTHGVLDVQATGVTVEGIKIVDAREYNYISYYGNTTFRNIKALSTMMCSDGITYGALNGVVEGAWLYVGDNGLVVGQSGNCAGRFSDIAIGTSCKAIFPQGNNTGMVMENIDVFRADEGLVSNVHNPGSAELSQTFFFKNLSGVDCTLFPRFFAGANMGTLRKTFGFENVSIPQSTGSSTWQSIGRSGKALTFYDDAGKPWTTGNYELLITNLWVAGSRSNGFADSEINNPDRVSISVVNNLVAPKIPAVPNRTVVDWTCPWKRFVGSSLQRDVRLANPQTGAQTLAEPQPRANLLADRSATRSVWQRHPSWQVKLDATTSDPDDGARIYRTRDATASNTGMYCDITDGFLRRGNGTYTLAFDARADLTNAVDQVTIQAKLLSNEKDVTVSFNAPNDGEWHRYTADIETTFDMEVTDLVGLHIRTPLNGASEIDYKNLSFVKSVPEPELSDLKLKASTDKANPVDYVENETITFTFVLDGVAELPESLAALEPLQVVWTRTGDDGVTTRGSGAISLSQGCSMTTSLAIPGIVRVTAYLAGSDGQKIAYQGADGKTANITFGGGAGVATERMASCADEPADFDAFWAAAKAKLATVPFDDSNVELVDVTPSGAANSFTIYAAKIPCYGPRPVTGWLMIPKNIPAGGLPVQANFDGYGCVSSAPSAPTWGVAGQIRFNVNAHGYDLVGQDNQYYKDFNDSINKTNRTFNGTTYSYGLAPQDYDTPSDTYFYYMAMRVMRAFEYLKSRPEWDGTTVIAEGGSQGGMQTMWAGGLVDGITKIRPSITWGCDIGCPWNGQGPYPSRTWGIPCVPGAFYFDAAFHAKRVPRICTAEITRVGLGDYTSPPRGVILSYHNLPCAATAKLVQGSDHGYVPPEPNQVFTLSKAAVTPDPPDPPDPPAPVGDATASDAPGFGWTNRVVTVTNVTAGAELTLSLATPDGTAVLTAVQTADSTGVATFDVSTAPGSNYVYSVSQGGEAIASGAFHTGGWNADGAWFLAVPDGQGGSTEVNGAWRLPPSGTNATSYIVGGDASFALVADARAAGSNRLVRVETEITYPALLAGNPPVNASFVDSLAVLTPATSDADGSPVWKAYVGEEWVELAGDIAAAAATPYVARLECDFSLASPRVRLSVSDDGGATFASLSDAATGAEWFVPNVADKRDFAEVMVEGTSTIDGIRGTLANADVAMANGIGYASLAEALAAGDVTLLTNAEWPANAPIGTVAVNRGGYTLLLPFSGVAVDGNTVTVSAGLCAISGEGSLHVTFADLADLVIETSGLTPAQIAADLLENGANGIPKWQSYVLGLDVTALPYADIAAGANPDTVEVSLGGVVVNESAGATVTYRVYEVDDLADFADGGTESEAFEPTETVTVPTSGSDAKFFRIKITIDLP